MGSMSIPEAQAMLTGLVARDVVLLRQGVPPISQALFSGQLEYIRRDNDESWKGLDEIWQDGGGDCEDLAAAVAAERTLQGNPSRAIVYKTGPRMYHTVVQDIRTGQLLDPSLTGGMGWRE